VAACLAAGGLALMMKGQGSAMLSGKRGGFKREIEEFLILGWMCSTSTTGYQTNFTCTAFLLKSRGIWVIQMAEISSYGKYCP